MPSNTVNDERLSSWELRKAFTPSLWNDPTQNRLTSSPKLAEELGAGEPSERETGVLLCPEASSQ